MELGCQRGTAVSKPKFHVPSPLVRNLRRPHSVAFQSFLLPGSKYFLYLEWVERFFNLGNYDKI